MITHCLECDTYFRVSIEQLKASQGNVKCGCCMTVFNAIESLLDTTETPSQTVTQSTVGSADQKTTGSVGSALLGPEASEKDPIDFVKKADDSSWTDINFTSDHNDVPEEHIDADFTSNEESETVLGESQDYTVEDLALFEKPLQADGHIELQEPKRSGGIWIFTSLLMLTMLAFQFIKFNPATMITKFSQLQFLCGIVDCPDENELINDTSKINLISRDVREHPQFRDVLLVNATLMNSADDRLPFPKLQLDLFDKVGRAIGSRQFAPDEYLDSSVNLAAGMKPELPVHIVLEVIGTGEETSSFEFKFL